jgi:hypothetical protein
VIIYKYFCPDRRTILQNRLIRFTPPGQFNDPFDCLPYVEGYNAEFLENSVNKVVDTNRANLKALGRDFPDEFWLYCKQELLRKYIADPSSLSSRHLNLSLRPRMNSEVGVLCVCADNKSILMWSHYSASHTGFALGFDSENDFFKPRPHEPREIGELRPVTYTNERVRITFPPSDADPSPDIFFTKNQEWAYEKEWRILRFLKEADQKPSDTVHLFAVPPSAIREVVFGTFAPADLIADLLLSKQKDSDLGHLQFYQAKLSPNFFQMDIIPYAP